MNHQSVLAAALLGALVLSACSDTSVDQSITGVPSLNAEAGGGTTHCEGVMPPGVYENVVVLPGKSCVLNNSIILRDVSALPGSALSMVDDQVGDNIRGINADQVIVQGGTVGGEIRIKGGGFPGVGASINNVLVTGGDVEVEKLEAGIIFIAFTQVPNGGIFASQNVTQVVFQVAANTVANSVEIFDNTGPASKFVNFNTAGVAVVCERNTPPFVGGPNFAPSRQGQCF